MPRREVALVPGEYYHIYNRGNNRQKIFLEEENYLFFLRRLREYLVEKESRLPKFDKLRKSASLAPPARIIAYCLIPNHFHLLVQPNDNALSRHLQKFFISYTKAFNTRYERVGALFQGAFKAKRIDRDEYLVYLSYYIHLNPVWAGLAKRPEDWGFSSYQDYLALRKGTLPDPSVILAHFPTRQAYRESVQSFMPSDAKKIAHLLLDDD
jgi:putative transposase